MTHASPARSPPQVTSGGSRSGPWEPSADPYIGLSGGPPRGRPEDGEREAPRLGQEREERANGDLNLRTSPGVTLRSTVTLPVPESVSPFFLPLCTQLLHPPNDEHTGPRRLLAWKLGVGWGLRSFLTTAYGFHCRLHGSKKRFPHPGVRAMHLVPSVTTLSIGDRDLRDNENKPEITVVVDQPPEERILFADAL